MTDNQEAAFSRQVGQRLRAIRRQRRWSLEDVERASEGRWSASAIGAYERGYRNLSLPRLQELARFYGVPMAVLLGEVDSGAEVEGAAPRIVLDLVALERTEQARPIARYAAEIRAERGDDDALVLSIRRDDVRALCSVTDLSEPELLHQLDEWGVLARSARATVDTLDVGADRAPVAGATIANIA